LSFDNIDAPSRGTPTNIRIYFIFLETRIIGLHFAADNMDLSSFNFFSGGLRKFFCFCKSDVSAVQDHPRSLIWLQSKARMRLPISPS